MKAAVDPGVYPSSGKNLEVQQRLESPSNPASQSATSAWTPTHALAFRCRPMSFGLGIVSERPNRSRNSISIC